MDAMVADHPSWIDDMFREVPETDVARRVSAMLDIRQGSERGAKG